MSGTAEVHLEQLVLECSGGALVLARFWAEVLGGRVRTDRPPPSPGVAAVDHPGGPPLLVVRTPEPKRQKLRLHLDLAAEDREAAVARLEALGATRLGEHDEWGARWTSMSDPEGHEFDVAQQA